MLGFVVIMYSHCAEVQRCMSAAKPHAAARTVSVFGDVAGGVPVEVVRVSWPPWAAALFVVLFLCMLPGWWAARREVLDLLWRYRWWRLMRRVRRGAGKFDHLQYSANIRSYPTRCRRIHVVEGA